MVNTVTTLKKIIESKKDLNKAKVLQSFFKTGKGDYGEGDIFFGLTVPECRKIVAQYTDMPLVEIKEILCSSIHEYRLIALLILVSRFEKGDKKQKKEVYDFYLKNIRWVNNWDLVDQTAYKIVGPYILENSQVQILDTLVHSPDLWQKRIAIVSTFAHIRKGNLEETFRLSKILMGEKHDLLHKAVGWMLRESGKKNVGALESFLEEYSADMPRTMLRYAIEKFPQEKRVYYLSKKGL